jgi:hypothetical protein
MQHLVSGSATKRLPTSIQQLADKNYEILKVDPDHPSLHFKKVGPYRSVRVGIAYRAPGVEDGDIFREPLVGQQTVNDLEYDRPI